MPYTDILAELGLAELSLTEGSLSVSTPIDGSELARLNSHSAADVDRAIQRAVLAFEAWRLVPAPRRGALVRLFGEELRRNKDALGRLVTLECGKILQEGFGEVQEMIDICDLAVGQSRQLFGLTIASERPGHVMRETWHPMGVCGVISAFNFPVAVWAWNAALALVCGNSVVWKPSEKTPLTALATLKIFEDAVAKFGDAPSDLCQVILGDRKAGEVLVGSSGVALISATGSTRMGQAVGPVVAARFGRCLLELGGNNAMIVAPSADLDLALRAIVFSAAGTSGQRCTSLRRLILHEDIYDELLPRLKIVFASLSVGNPLAEGIIMGPLIDQDAHDGMQRALATAEKLGGRLTGGERVLADDYSDAFYVKPAIAEMPSQLDITKQETFAPILYAMRYRDLGEAIDMHNDVPQGLSSCIFTTDIREAETFLSAIGSDCGIANVNIGPSGAEIGGAFGGEKETGGGREAGSDSWRAYMRRQTNTINYSHELPLAQGVDFNF